MRKLFLLLAVLGMSGFAVAAERIDPARYQKIVCFGDSITHGGKYPSLLQLDLAVRHPESPCRVLNRGFSGDMVSGLLKRAPEMLDADKPDLVLVMVGINDLQFTTKFKDKALSLPEAVKKYPVFTRYDRDMRKLLALFRERGVKAVLLTPPPYSESANPEIRARVNENLNSCGVANLRLLLQKIAADTGTELIDVYTPLLENLKKNDAAFPRGKGDRVHPSPAEHQLIAAAILGHTPEAGKKTRAAEKYGMAQARIQSLKLIERRIPAGITGDAEKTAWLTNWVESLKNAGEREYHRKGIETFKNRKRLFEQYGREENDAWNTLYPGKK